MRLLPLSITLILAAAGIPRFFPRTSPRRVARIGFLALFAGLVVMVGALDAGAGPEIVTWPMLLAGLGIGALASQLGSVTVSSVPDEQSGEVGGLQRGDRRGDRPAGVSGGDLSGTASIAMTSARAAALHQPGTRADHTPSVDACRRQDLSGTGERIAVVELGGLRTSHVAAFAGCCGLPTPT